MNESRQRDNKQLEDAVRKAQERTHTHIVDVEKDSDPQLGIFRAPWWAWGLTIIGVGVIVWLVSLLHDYVMSLA